MSRTLVQANWSCLAGWARARAGEAERGTVMMEYALLVAVIAVVCLGAISYVSQALKGRFLEAGDGIE